MLEKAGLRILSLDGDEVSVLAELTIIHETMYRIQNKLNLLATPLPCDWFQLMGGTGTGGLVAILLGRLRLSADEAIRCYLTIVREVFDRRRVKPQDREAELERMLKGVLERYCNDADASMIEKDSGMSTCKVIVYAMPTVAMQAGTPTCIRSYYVAENQGPRCSIIDAARATTATPGILKRKAIYDEEVEMLYMGAVLGCNNPTALLLHEAGRAYPGRATACIFSAGAGQLPPISFTRPRRLLESISSQVAAAAEATAMDCERVHQEVSARFLHTEGLYFRFNPEQGLQEIDRSDPARASDVCTHAKAYLKDTAQGVRLNNAVKAIVDGKEVAKLVNGNVIILSQNILPIGQCPAPSTTFTGREDLLAVLYAYFFDRSYGRHTFVLYGLGGAGKTQLALAFVDRHKQLFWDVFYIDASTHDTIKAGLKQISEKTKAGDTAENTLRWLVSQKYRWLLVYNNADDPAIDLSDYFPKCAHGDILITTRNRDMIIHTAGPKSHCRVGDMEEEDAVSLFFKTSGVPKSPESQAMANTLAKASFLALAIVQAGAYIRSTQCAIPQYLSLFLSSRDRLLRTQRVSQTDGYKLTVYTTWDVSYKHPLLLRQAAQLLGVMSFMHHDGISASFFETAATKLSGFELTMPLTEEESAIKKFTWDFLGSLLASANTWDILGWQELTNNLRSFSLLDYDPASQMYSMRPLVHSWCRSVVPDPRAARECAAWVLSLCVKWKRSSEDFGFRRLLVPHAMAVLEADESITPSLAEDIGMIFEDARYAKQTEKLFAHALKSSQDRLGHDHLRTLALMHSLASSYCDQGRWEEAQGLLDEAVGIGKRVLGEEHPNVLSTIHTLASTYLNQGQWKEAEGLVTGVLEIRRRVLGKEDPQLLSITHTLALTYINQGRWEEAETLLTEVLAAQRKAFGDEHPKVLSTIHTLASIFRHQRRWRTAETLLKEFLKVRRRIFGKEHPLALSTAYQLALSYNEEGREKEAETMILEVVELQNRVLGKEHPDSIYSTRLLASTYYRQGRISEAVVLQANTLNASKRIIGSQHPETLALMHDLAVTFKAQGRLQEAEKLMAETSELYAQVMGDQHPYAKTSARRLVTIRKLAHQRT